MTARLVTGLCLFALILEGYDILMFGLVVPSLFGYQPGVCTPVKSAGSVRSRQ